MGYFSCRNIEKSYGSVVALRDATLEIEKGELRAILGGNGSGKSTLAKIIGGSVYADGGEITLRNQKMDVRSPLKSRRQRLIITSQELSLFTNLTVAENLTLINSPKRFSLFRDNKAAGEKSRKILERLGLADIKNKPVNQLPDDKKYLVEFAKALLFEPEILVIDEITSALYREQVEIVKEILHELSAEGCSVLFISHRMTDIYSICSTVTVMRNGRTLDTYNLKDVQEEDLLRSMIGEDTARAHKTAKHASVLSGSGKVLLSVKEFRIPGFNQAIDFELRSGEVVGIAGLQGQGQSELLKALFGESGKVQVTLDDKSVKIDSPRRAIKAGIGYITGDREKDGVFIGRSVAENLEVVNSNVLNRARLDSKKLFGEYKVKYNSSRQPIQTLSGGNQQKVILARWTGVEPKVLLADDPTKGVDVLAREDVHHILKNLAGKGSGVIMVSSDEEELVLMADIIDNYRVAVMYNGNFVSDLRGKDITIANIISASMPRSEKNA